VASKGNGGSRADPGPAVEEVDKRRSGVAGPAQETGREEAFEPGVGKVKPNWPGLPFAVEKVAEVGVVDPGWCCWCSYSTNCGPGLPISGGLYASIVFSVRLARAVPSWAITIG